ncbi:MAG: hypothetical protein M3094_00230, partial [Actinomycetia bacterium]|nr:hypothetical protein [Actinomycetes bacterium]
SELATQIAAIESLDELPAVTLSAAERSTLRSNLVTQLHLEPAATPAPAPRHTSRWWKPVAGLAAVAAIAVAFVAGPGLLFGGSDSAEDVALVATDSVSRDESPDVAQGGESGLAESAPSVTSTAAEDFVVESFALIEISASQVSQLLLRSAEVDSVSEGNQKLTGDAGAVTSVEFAVLEDCIDRLGDALPARDLVPLAVTTTEGAQVVHLGVGTEGVVTSVISLDLDACQVTSTIP